MKKKLMATMALTAAISVANILPAFAYTADGPWGPEQHTTFGIQEGSGDEFKNQASFEVPLYVTMAAINEDNKKGEFATDRLITPKGYDIKNSATNAGSYIAVQSFDVEMYNTAKWSIVDAAPTTNLYDMTFRIGKVNLKPQTAGTAKTYATDAVYQAAGTKKDQSVYPLKDGIFEKTDGTLKVLDAQEYLSSGTKNPGVGIELYGGIKSGVRTGKKDDGTAAQFKVVYHMVSTDEQGNVKTAASYIGDDRKAAGYK